MESLAQEASHYCTLCRWHIAISSQLRDLLCFPLHTRDTTTESDCTSAIDRFRSFVIFIHLAASQLGFRIETQPAPNVAGEIMTEDTSAIDDFVFVDTEELPLRPKVQPDAFSTTPRIDLRTINASSGEILVSIVPPLQPSGGLQHTPCDIVLVIDVSASMNTAAELPDTIESGAKELSAWSILDLVKHASRTVLENLNEHDRLAIVTFSTDARVIQGLLPMTEEGKAETRSKLEALTVHDSTNLWAGLREGLGVFTNTPAIGNAQGMYVLTDGAPNHLNPAQGFRKKLTPILKELESEKGHVPIVSTFGFGYHLRSSLLRSIAEVGRGTYAFIPDAGMIGTVFVHAVANLLSTYTTNNELIIECSNTLATIETPLYYGFHTKGQHDVQTPPSTTSISLGNVQYGQSRDFFIKIHNAKPSDMLKATMRFQIPHQGCDTITTRQKFQQLQPLPRIITDYHISRHELCTFLASLSYESCYGEHAAFSADKINEFHKDLEVLISRIASRLDTPDDNVNKVDLAALFADLKSTNPTEIRGHGQIGLALRTDSALGHTTNPTAASYQSSDGSNGHLKAVTPMRPMHALRTQPFYTRWGQHYLPSILHAHAYQLPMTFKDPGPQRYCINSPLFIKCRDDLDNAFDKLPTPTPSLAKQAVQQHPYAYQSAGSNAAGNPASCQPRPAIQISRFNRVDSACFTGDCVLRCIDGNDDMKHHKKRVDEVCVGDTLWTATGNSRTVKEIVMTPVRSQKMIGLNGCTETDTKETLWITPWHPVLIEGKWTFPESIPKSKTAIMHHGNVYSFLLEQDENDDMAHTVEVGGIICVTLGHGLIRPDLQGDNATNAEVDVRCHPFFGDYTRVIRELTRLDMDEYGRRISGGVGKRRSGDDGMSADEYGFLRPDEVESVHLQSQPGYVLGEAQL